MAITKLTNLVNPEVMGAMISATLPKKIKFSKIAKIDTTLVAQPGNTITVPKYAYIGDAIDVAEGGEIDTVVLTTTTTQATVKKAGKGVEISDEAVLSGYGDPVGNATNQLTMAIAAKMDNDCLDALLGATLKYVAGATEDAPTVPTEKISYAGIVNAVDLFEDESDTPTAKIMFVNPKQITTLRLDADFRDINKYPLQTVMTGVIGEIAGCQIVPSKKIVAVDGAYANPIVVVDAEDSNEVTNSPALTIYMKKDVMTEGDRDITTKTNIITADQHYTAVLSNDSKVVIAKFKA